LIVLLVVLGMVSTKRLRGWWRHALLAAFIVAAIVTPTPDPITQTMLALPLYGLFWIAILVASQVERRKAAAEEEDVL
jgi:sec-independent protein translocase protein TatC